jgi:2',3'-cyclic-nucleotide 2'-phosphodiesterase (5'-nucleotidase family)
MRRHFRIQSFSPGLITIGDILEILPFEDPAIVIEVDGAILWDAIESSLKTWPAQEGLVYTTKQKNSEAYHAFIIINSDAFQQSLAFASLGTLAKNLEAAC